MTSKGYPWITITHDLAEGTVTTSIRPGISDKDLQKVGFIIRVALFNFADVLRMKDAEEEMGEMDEEISDEPKPPAHVEADHLPVPKRMYG